MSSEITTVSFFTYEALAAKYWAFTQMGLAHRSLKQVEGLNFYKLMGSGAGNGFSLRPDFSVYGLLCVWSDEASARRFFANHPQHLAFLQRSEKQFRIYLHAANVKGRWNNQQPFAIRSLDTNRGAIAVLTRARIANRRLIEFWRHVPASSRAITGRPGLLFSKGIGEWPVFQQATFSIWADKESMRQFAYRDETHRKIIQRTHQRQWYSEEMFVEFVPFHIEGDWTGAEALRQFML